jgi:hypothetical protein
VSSPLRKRLKLQDVSEVEGGKGVDFGVSPIRNQEHEELTSLKMRSNDKSEKYVEESSSSSRSSWTLLSSKKGEIIVHGKEDSQEG